MEEGLKVFNEYRDGVIASGLEVIPFENGMMRVDADYVQNRVATARAKNVTQVALRYEFGHGVMIEMFARDQALKERHQVAFKVFCDNFSRLGIEAVEYTKDRSLKKVFALSFLANGDDYSRLEEYTREKVKKHSLGKVALAWNLFEQSFTSEEKDLFIEFIVYE